MKVSGTWETPEAFQFHKIFKTRFQRMIESDPEATGSTLDMIRDVEFERKLAVHEDGDYVHKNEEYIKILIENYRTIFSELNPPMKERILEKKFTDFVFSLFRNDSAYRTRIGGIVTFIVKHADKFQDPGKNYLEELQMIRDWWLLNDRRNRTHKWIDWGFKFIMKKYESELTKTDKDKFYMKSVNFCFQYIYVNKDLWIDMPEYNPLNWYGYYQGVEVNELHMGNF